MTVPILSAKYAALESSSDNYSEKMVTPISRNCHNCGCLSSESSIFCDNCGTKL